jgi:uncharacterized membrane protein
MENYVSIVFDNDAQAGRALHELWKLDSQGDVTVHGAAVIRREQNGMVDVATKETDIGARTLVGVGVGLLLGALAGPIGAAAGKVIATGTALGTGAAVGGAAGLTAEGVKSGERDQAGHEAAAFLPRGKSAVVAEVSESWTTPIDSMAQRLGGEVNRRAKDDVRRDLWEGDYTGYLYPYDYEPVYA